MKINIEKNDVTFEESYYDTSNETMEMYFEEKEHYTPSSTAGDYGPSNPWQAPGMSVRDFF